MTDTVDATSIARALGDRTRARIAALLQGHDLCVCELTEVLAQSQANVSGHLKVLVSSGLVTSYRRSYWTHYTLARVASPDVQHFLDLVIAQATAEYPCDISSLEQLPADICASRHARE
jgi:DNA-binding transcriptional ArsR family regulator